MTAATDQLGELQRRLAELTTVQRVARAINSTLDLDAIFQTVVVQINTAFNYQMVSIYLREGDGLRLQAYLGYDEVIEFIGLNQGVSGRVARTAQPVFVSDEAQDPDFLVAQPGTQQAIIVPLKDADGQVLGTLAVESLGQPVLTQNDFTILTLLADQISVAIVNVRLFAERKRAEAEQLALARKLLEARQAESLGVLAGGIAHDFNNLLQVIIGNVELAITETANPQRVRTSLNRITEAAQRAADLTRQLLAYAGKGRYLVERVDLELAMADALTQLRSALPATVKLRYSATPNLPTVQADLAQIRQAVMNLVLNAAEACGRSDGEIVVAIGWERVDPTQAGAAEPLADLAAGDYVFMEVADSGPGMDQATQARMFEPFFTTKFTGRGLGLAAVQGIIRSHQGALRVWSAPQQGTRVRFWLPCSSDTHAHGDVTADQSARSSGKVDRAPASDIILVIDDEDGVRNVAARLLKRAGWTVLTAADGRAGIDVFQANAHAIGCVLLDLTMPHMSGEQVFYELRRIRPDLRIILCSGYSEANATSRFNQHELAGFLHKPFTPEELRDKIQRVLRPEDSS